MQMQSLCFCQACNVISQTPNGRFTLVIPRQHRNCSFSIIYPVSIKISDLTLGHVHGLQLKVSGLLASWVFGEATALVQQMQTGGACSPGFKRSCVLFLAAFTNPLLFQLCCKSHTQVPILTASILCLWCKECFQWLKLWYVITIELSYTQVFYKILS